MKFTKIIFILSAVFFTHQCTTKNILQREYKGTDAILLSGNVKMSAYKFESYGLNEMSITGDTITLNLSYSGGCRNHEFHLIAEKKFGKLSDSRANLVLSHNNNYDPCERYITENRSFNLLPLKYAYIQKFRKNSGSIRMTLEGKTIVYEFH